ncbi:MAG TPA: hypothetical protein VNB06_06655 [Thermoanaerobaculia bacterium]|nr:hypothetical protein [Thermoanaerobaculia bacterium]
MNRLDRTTRFAGLLLAVLVLVLSGAAPSFAAQEAAKADKAAKSDQIQAQAIDKDQGVTFVNRSRDTQNVLAVYGGDKCEEMTDRAQVTIEPGQNATVESGDELVCWCASTLGKVGNCTVWTKAKSGKSVTIR